MSDLPKDAASAHAWLDEASRMLDLDPATVRQLAKPLLDLTREVAHNRSRPAAPLTAFLVGLASREGEDLAEISARVDKLVERIEEGK